MRMYLRPYSVSLKLVSLMQPPERKAQYM